MSKKYWLPDSAASSCTSCGQPFTLFRRRHHCRFCGKIFCQSCSSQTTEGKSIGMDGFVRVCDPCFELTNNPHSRTENLSSRPVDVLSSLARHQELEIPPAESVSDEPGSGSTINSSTTGVGNKGYSSAETRNIERETILRQNNSLRFRRFRGNEFDDIFDSGGGGIDVFDDKKKVLPLSIGLFNRPVNEDSAKLLRSLAETADVHLDHVVGKAVGLYFPELGLSSPDCSLEDLSPAQLAWKITILRLARKAVSTIDMNYQAGDSPDIRSYVKIKKMAVKDRADTGITRSLQVRVAPLKYPVPLSGTLPPPVPDYTRIGDSEWISGIAFRRNLPHKRMITEISDPRVVLLNDGVQFDVGGNSRFLQLGTLIEQENNYTDLLVSKILALQPHVLLVSGAISRFALERLLARGVTCISNVSMSIITRVSRSTGARVLPSINYLDKLSANEIVGTQCKYFSIRQTDDGVLEPLIIFDNCPPHLQGTILLRGNREDLVRAKAILRHAIFVGWCLRFQTSYYFDSFMLPSNPLVARPSQLSSDSTNISALSRYSKSSYHSDGAYSLSASFPLDTFPNRSSESLLSLVDVITGNLPPTGASPLEQVDGPAHLKQLMLIPPSQRSRLLRALLELPVSPGLDYSPMFLPRSLPPISVFPPRLPRSLHRIALLCGVDAHLLTFLTGFGLLDESNPAISSINSDAQPIAGATGPLPDLVAAETGGVLPDPLLLLHRTHDPISVSSEMAGIVVTNTWVSDSLQCSRPRLRSLRMYTAGDRSLGAFLQARCFDERAPCPGCQRGPHSHLLSFFHGNLRLDVTVHRLALPVPSPVTFHAPQYYSNIHNIGSASSVVQDEFQPHSKDSHIANITLSKNIFSSKTQNNSSKVDSRDSISSDYTENKKLSDEEFASRLNTIPTETAGLPYPHVAPPSVSHSDIMTWSYCPICRLHTSPLTPLSRATHSMSFAHFLTQYFCNSAAVSAHPQCKHSPFLHHIRYFGRGRIAVAVRLCPIVPLHLSFRGRSKRNDVWRLRAVATEAHTVAEYLRAHNERFKRHFDSIRKAASVALVAAQRLSDFHSDPLKSYLENPIHGSHSAGGANNTAAPQNINKSGISLDTLRRSVSTHTHSSTSSDSIISRDTALMLSDLSEPAETLEPPSRLPEAPSVVESPIVSSLSKRIPFASLGISSSPSFAAAVSSIITALSNCIEGLDGTRSSSERAGSLLVAAIEAETEARQLLTQLRRTQRLKERLNRDVSQNFASPPPLFGSNLSRDQDKHSFSPFEHNIPDSVTIPDSLDVLHTAWLARNAHIQLSSVEGQLGMLMRSVLKHAGTILEGLSSAIQSLDGMSSLSTTSIIPSLPTSSTSTSAAATTHANSPATPVKRNPRSNTVSANGTLSSSSPFSALSKDSVGIPPVEALTPSSSSLLANNNAVSLIENASERDAVLQVLTPLFEALLEAVRSTPPILQPSRLTLHYGDLPAPTENEENEIGDLDPNGSDSNPNGSLATISATVPTPISTSAPPPPPSSLNPSAATSNSHSTSTSGSMAARLLLSPGLSQSLVPVQDSLAATSIAYTLSSEVYWVKLREHVLATQQRQLLSEGSSGEGMEAQSTSTGVVGAGTNSGDNVTSGAGALIPSRGIRASTIAVPFHATEDSSPLTQLSQLSQRQRNFSISSSSLPSGSGAALVHPNSVSSGGKDSSGGFFRTLGEFAVSLTSSSTGPDQQQLSLQTSPLLSGSSSSLSILPSSSLVDRTASTSASPLLDSSSPAGISTLLSPTVVTSDNEADTDTSFEDEERVLEEENVPIQLDDQPLNLLSDSHVSVNINRNVSIGGTVGMRSPQWSRTPFLGASMNRGISTLGVGMKSLTNSSVNGGLSNSSSNLSSPEGVLEKESRRKESLMDFPPLDLSVHAHDEGDTLPLLELPSTSDTINESLKDSDIPENKWLDEATDSVLPPLQRSVTVSSSRSISASSSTPRSAIHGARTGEAFSTIKDDQGTLIGTINTPSKSLTPRGLPSPTQDNTMKTALSVDSTTKSAFRGRVERRHSVSLDSSPLIQVSSAGHASPPGAVKAEIVVRSPLAVNNRNTRNSRNSSSSTSDAVHSRLDAVLRAADSSEGTIDYLKIKDQASSTASGVEVEDGNFERVPEDRIQLLAFGDPIPPFSRLNYAIDRSMPFISQKSDIKVEKSAENDGKRGGKTGLTISSTRVGWSPLVGDLHSARTASLHMRSKRFPLSAHNNATGSHSITSQNSSMNLLRMNSLSYGESDHRLVSTVSSSGFTRKGSGILTSPIALLSSDGNSSVDSVDLRKENSFVSDEFSGSLTSPSFSLVSLKNGDLPDALASPTARAIARMRSSSTDDSEKQMGGSKGGHRIDPSSTRSTIDRDVNSFANPFADGGLRIGRSGSSSDNLVKKENSQHVVSRNPTTPSSSLANERKTSSSSVKGKGQGRRAAVTILTSADLSNAMDAIRAEHSQAIFEPNSVVHSGSTTSHHTSSDANEVTTSRSTILSPVTTARGILHHAPPLSVSSASSVSGIGLNHSYANGYDYGFGNTGASSTRSALSTPSFDTNDRRKSEQPDLIPSSVNHSSISLESTSIPNADSKVNEFDSNLEMLSSKAVGCSTAAPTPLSQGVPFPFEVPLPIQQSDPRNFGVAIPVPSFLLLQSDLRCDIIHTFSDSSVYALGTPFVNPLAGIVQAAPSIVEVDPVPSNQSSTSNLNTAIGGNPHHSNESSQVFDNPPPGSKFISTAAQNAGSLSTAPSIGSSAPTVPSNTSGSSNGSGVVGGTAVISVTSYWATHFHALRELTVGSQREFVASLSRAVKWNTSGGKSGAQFERTADRRFVVKYLSRTEFEMFIVDIAPAYFAHMSGTLVDGQPSLLVKIFGFYKVQTTIGNSTAGNINPNSQGHSQQQHQGFSMNNMGINLGLGTNTSLNVGVNMSSTGQGLGSSSINSPSAIMSLNSTIASLGTSQLPQGTMSGKRTTIFCMVMEDLFYFAKLPPQLKFDLKGKSRSQRAGDEVLGVSTPDNTHIGGLVGFHKLLRANQVKQQKNQRGQSALSGNSAGGMRRDDEDDVDSDDRFITERVRSETQLYDMLNSSVPSATASTSTSNPVGSKKSSLVLFDKDLLRHTRGLPLPFTSESHSFLRRALRRDVLFLRHTQIVDFSILLGVNEETGEAVLGIIDYLRRFDLVKRLENRVKTVTQLATNEEPTVVQPSRYAERLLRASERYFMPVPDRWSSAAHLSSPDTLDYDDLAQALVAAGSGAAGSGTVGSSSNVSGSLSQAGPGDSQGKDTALNDTSLSALQMEAIARAKEWAEYSAVAPYGTVEPVFPGMWDISGLEGVEDYSSVLQQRHYNWLAAENPPKWTIPVSK